MNPLILAVVIATSAASLRADPAPVPLHADRTAPDHKDHDHNKQPRDARAPATGPAGVSGPVAPPRDPAEGVLAAVHCPAKGRLNSSELAIDTSAGPLHVGLRTYPQTLKLKDHEVVLTFDDGPWPATTPTILAALRAECVRANFFVIGRHADAAPDLVRQEVEDGDIVGHHSYTHPTFTLRGFDQVSGEQDIDAGIAAVERAGYGDAARPVTHPHVPFFRFPGFADTPALLEDLDHRHLAVFGTDIWAADWLQMSPDYERRHVMDQLERAPRHSGIVLLHDTRPSTAQMMPAFLAELKAKGYHVVELVPVAIGPLPPLATAPKGWVSQTEKIIAHVWPKIEPGMVHALPPGPDGGPPPAADFGNPKPADAPP